MKRTFFAIFVVLSLWAGLEMAPAQSEEMPVPKPPYLTPVPDYGHWKVTFKYEAAAPATTPTPSTSAELPTTVETIKTGDLRGVTLTFAKGPPQQFTCQGDWVLNSSAKGAQLRIVTPLAIPYPYYTTGFIFLDGIKVDPSTFKEAVPHNGVIAFHYRSNEVDVWIDPTSMHPLAAKKDGVEASYEFMTPPPRPFPIPQDQESLLQKEQQAYKATSSMR